MSMSSTTTLTWEMASTSRRGLKSSIRRVALAEGEDVGLHAGSAEFDLERAVGDGARPANELVEPWLDHRSVAKLVDVEPTRVAGRLSVHEHTERHGRARLARPQDEVNVAGVEPEGDTATGAVHRGGPRP